MGGGQTATEIPQKNDRVRIGRVYLSPGVKNRGLSLRYPRILA